MPGRVPLLLLNNTEYTSTTFRAQHDVVVRELPFDVSNASVKTEVVVGHRAMSEPQWVRGMQLWLSVSAFQKVLLRCSLRYLTAISGIPTAVLCDALIDFLLGGSATVPELGPVAADYEHALGHPNDADHGLLESVLGAGALPEDRHLQAVVHAVVADPARHLPLLREACGYLVERFALQGTEGLSYLAGAMTLDAAGGSMYRAGLVHRQLRSVFAVAPAVLAVAIAAGDLPPMEHDASAGVLHGSVVSAPERSSYPVSGYVLLLNKGSRKLLWDGEWSLFASGAPSTAPPQPVHAAVAPDRHPLAV